MAPPDLPVVSGDPDKKDQLLQQALAHAYARGLGVERDEEVVLTGKAGPHDFGEHLANDAAQRANALWKRSLAEYEQPSLDDAVSEELREWIERKKASFPDSDV